MTTPLSHTSGTPAQAWHCPPRTIVAAVDFEAASARAVGLAGQIAATTGAALRVVHAERSEMPPYFTPAQIAQLEQERAEATRELADELQRFARQATRWPVESVVAEGPPVDTILHAAVGADLLVLGTHGRRGPARWWLGSVAERIVRAAPLPVLVARAEGAGDANVFARVLLVGDGREPAAAARDCLARLTTVMGGTVVGSGALDHCAPDLLADATLVAVAARPERPRWSIGDSVADALGRCPHPVLFLPHRPEGRS